MAESTGAIDVLAFSGNANYVASHFVEDANVGIHFRLRYTSELVSKDIEGYPSPAYSMTFSSDNELLAVASSDGNVRVWSSATGKYLYSLPLDSTGRVPVSYIPGTYNLLVTRGPALAAVIDPTGHELMRIEARSPIRRMRLLSDGRRAAVLTEENRLEIYDLAKGRHLGYLPSFNVTGITSFAFSSDDSHILMGHEDGSIYKVAVGRNLVAARSMPVLRLIGEDEVVVRGEEFTESIPPAPYMEIAPPDSDGLSPLFKRPSHGVELLAGATLLPDPYMLGIDLGVGYTNGILPHPFYLGARFSWSVGLPKDNFPHEYEVYGQRFDSPLMLSFALGIPFGIVLTPFSSNRDVELSIEVSLGSALHYLWNREFGGRTISSHVYPAFAGSLALGVGWRGLTLRVCGDYDKQLGFMLGMSLGYTFALPSGGRDN